MSESTHDNLPLADDPTREFSVADQGSDSFDFDHQSSGQEQSLGQATPKPIAGYEIRQLIGSGGMGNVYLAEHQRMQRVVAIKVLPVERMQDQFAVERFYGEIRAASRLMHPNIVTAFDAGDSNGVHYLAMEYVDGKTLTRIIAEDGPMSVGEAAAVIRQAALGLLHAHRAGIVHRDVKPGNLMRASDGTIKVLDLGLARMNAVSLSEAETSDPAAGGSRPSSKGRLVGTLPFMSPEQLEDPDAADPRSDIYSLGATLYFLLTASPPFSGEYLDQVYGHRHGEIPDLMQTRGDVDMNFANIFCRMMAKSPEQRYASLDEVIEDLGRYANQADTPPWLAEFSYRPSVGEFSTVSGGSTSASATRVFAIDLGMFYSATAEAAPWGGVKSLPAGGKDRPLFRMALASEGGQLFFDNEAIERRAEFPHQLVHCLPIYIGKPLVEREVAGRQCPPEVLMAMLLRQIRKNAWPGNAKPHATAITVPASYDQLHRQSILQAAQMADLPSVRLVDRSIACVQSLLIDEELSSLDGTLSSLGGDPATLQMSTESMILFVGITGQASEAAVVRRDSARLHQLATAGHWHTGTLPWLHRLVDLAAQAFLRQYHVDPRQSNKTASNLQIACERAMNAMLLMPSATVTITIKGEKRSVKIERQEWIDACESLITGVRKTIKQACKQASVTLSQINVCVTLGPLLRIAAVRDAILSGISEGVEWRPLDRSDAARGAAACLAAELPGRGDIAMPPRVVTGQTIGIVVEDLKQRRRILPIIPKGTLLPARTNRRLTVGSERTSMTLSLVESSGVQGNDWHALGRHEFEVGDSLRNNRMRMIGFEINVNGMLTVRAQAPGTPASIKLPPLPPPVLSDEAVAEWTQWLDSLR